MKTSMLLVLAVLSVAAVQGTRRSVALVVVGRTVLTQDAAHRVVSPGAVAIDGRDIVDVDTPEAIGRKYAALETIESGTTTFADMYYFEEEIAKVAIEAGLRGVLGETIIQFPVADAKTPADALTRADAFIEQFKNDPLITPAVAPHAMYTLDGPTLKAARELSRRHGVPTLIHVAETRDEF